MNLKNNSGRRGGTLAPLLSNTPEALYWMGFLLADGHFTETRLQVVLAEKDTEHLQSLSKFLGGVKLRLIENRCQSGVFRSISLAIMHTEVVKKLRERWGIASRKTYTPPNLSKLSEEELIFVMIGFIDGDGHIARQRKSKTAKVVIRLGNHSSWAPTLQLFSEIAHKMVQKPSATVIITKRNVAILKIKEEEVVRMLYLFSEKIPSLKRKWEKIGENYISIQEKMSERDTKLQTLLEEGRQQVEIAKMMGMSVSNLSKTIHRHDLRKKSL